MGRHGKFQCDSGVTARKNKKWLSHCQRRMNEEFVICYTPEDSIAISEPVMFQQ